MAADYTPIYQSAGNTFNVDPLLAQAAAGASPASAPDAVDAFLTGKSSPTPTPSNAADDFLTGKSAPTTPSANAVGSDDVDAFLTGKGATPTAPAPVGPKA